MKGANYILPSNIAPVHICWEHEKEKWFVAGSKLHSLNINNEKKWKIEQKYYVHIEINYSITLLKNWKRSKHVAWIKLDKL